MKDQSVAKKSVIIISAMLLAAALVLICASSVSAEKQSRVNGLKPVLKDVYKVPGTKKSGKKLKKKVVLPKYYRSDEQEWASNVKVKDQKNSGLCWAFSMTTAAEYSYANETYDDNSMVSETSPGHLGWFFYNRVNDPLKLTAGDKNLTFSDYTWVQGGDQINGMQHMATWSGLALEGASPNDFDTLVNKHINSKGKWIGTKHPYSDDKAYDDYVTQEECIIYPAPGGTSKEIIKRLVYRYGAVSTGLVFDWENYMNCDETDKNGIKYPEGRSFYNYTDDNNMNHAVTIIGWDDNYPKENFTHTKDADGKQLSYYNDEYKETDYTDEEAAALTTPEKDGAWIVQNSWGKGEHDNGIFYVSYESCGQSTDAGKANRYSDVSVYDMQPADTYKYNFQYDGTADSGDSSQRGNEDFFTAKGTSAANVFTNTTTEAITLDAVGFTTYNDGETAYTIKIYTDLTDPDDPSSGTLKSTSEYKSYTPGTKTAVLDNSVKVGIGETYSIVFEFKQDTHFGVEKKTLSDDYEVKTAPGQSFFRPADSSLVSGIIPSIISGKNKWVDIYNEDENKSACFRIKGFANPERKYYTYEKVLYRFNETANCFEVAGCEKGLSGNVEIPAYFKKKGDDTSYPVTSICAGAFKGESGIKSVTLPETLIQINEDAFVNTGLKQIVIPASVITIKNHAVGIISEIIDGIGIYYPVEGFVIYADSGSKGEKYAERNGITCKTLEDKAQEDAEAAEAAKAAEEAKKAEEARKEKERKAAEAAKAKQARISRAKAAQVKIKAKALKKRKVRLTWKKISGVSGYEVYKSKKKNAGFKKAAVLKANAVSWKSGKIKKGKKAFFKVRPFTLISGSKVYGKWSNVAKVKLKK